MLSTRTLWLVVVLFGVSIVPAKADIIWHWSDRFTQSEKNMLTQWIRTTVQGVEDTAGPYPFDVHIYFHRANTDREPVPWAHTERSSRQGVRFHVSTKFELDEFLADWTAPHELSHLLMPYLGNGHKWFAEGFASFMQYQVMQTMGVLKPADVRRRYRTNIRYADQSYSYDGMPFTKAAKWLHAQRKFPVMYWGGAVYFLQVNEALNAKNDSLVKVVTRYLRCCRKNHSDLPTLLEDLDQVSSQSVFSDRAQALDTKPGFPEYRDLLGTQL